MKLVGTSQMDLDENTYIEIRHPKFGEGCIEEIEQGTGSVSLHIRFGEELKVIDPKWLLRTKYQKKE